MISIMAGGDKSNRKSVAKRRKEHHRDNSKFILNQFPHPPLWKFFLEKFLSRSILTSYFVNLDNSENLAICDKTLSDLLVDMG